MIVHIDTPDTKARRVEGALSSSLLTFCSLLGLMVVGGIVAYLFG